jgi:two-component system nitrate/nitrite response regulator NarP
MLEKLSLGMTNQELADVMAISQNTVKFHLKNVYSKLNVRNRAEAVALYYNDGETPVLNTIS